MLGIFHSRLFSQLLPLVICAVVGVGFILLAYSFAVPVT
jgi:hypothetical protein